MAVPLASRNRADLLSQQVSGSARLRHIAGKTWGAKRYLDMTRLKTLQTESAVSQDQTA
jgi:hypothetical protein